MAAGGNATRILGVAITGVTGDPNSNLVYANTPTLITPILGVATATSINNLAISAPSSKSLTVSNTLTFTGTDGSSVNFAAGGTVAYTNVATLSSLTSVGAIAVGTWNATPIATNKGGTPTGGTIGQVLRKNSSTDYDYSWATVSGGGSGTVTSVTGTTNRITIGGTPTVAPVVDIASSYVGQASITTLGTITTGTWSATAIAAIRGGTGQTTYATGDIIYASAPNVLSKRAIGTAGQVLTVAAGVPTWATPSSGGGSGTVTSVSGVLNRTTITGTPTINPTVDISATYVGQTSITTLGTIATGTWNATAISAIRGGTGLTTVAAGSLLRSTALNTWSALAPGTNGQVLQMIAGVPAWGTVSGAGTVTSVSGSGGTTGLTLTGGPITTSGTLTLGGTLLVTSGGTGITTTTQGDIFYGGVGNTIAKLPKSILATRYLSNQGSANDPVWAQVNLANGVTGTLPLSNLPQGLARSVLGVTGNAAASVASIQGTTNQVLRIDNAGTGLQFGSINLASSAAVGTSILPVANGGTGLSVLTNARVIMTNGTGAYAQVLPTGSNGVVITAGAGSLNISNTVNPARQTFVDTSGTATWNFDNGAAGNVVLTGTGRTVVFAGTPVPGTAYTLEVRQDGTGGRTITTWPASIDWEGGSAPALTPGANKIDLFTFYYTGVVGSLYLGKLVGTFN